MLAEAKFEILKQECKVDSLNACIHELQRQAHSHRLEWDSREQARLHEDLALREKALRDTRIRTIHSKEELKSAQEVRVDEFSMHATIQELTSQIQELQEMVNCMNDSREFQNTESTCSGKLFHGPSQPAVVPGPRSMLSRDQSMPPNTWNLSGTQGNTFGNPRAMLDSSQIPYQGFFTLRIKVLQIESQCKGVQGDLSRKVKNKLETIPIPILARRPSTMNSFSPAMVDPQRLHGSELHFDKFPTLSTYSCWKIRFKTQVCSCSDFALGGYVGRFSG